MEKANGLLLCAGEIVSTQKGEGNQSREGKKRASAASEI
jgi:hypothetical protein